MPTPDEHKTVQARILGYAEAIGWTFVTREEAERRRGFDPEVPPAERAKNRSLFFDDLLDAKLREFNPRYAEAEGALLGAFRHLHTDIHGNREFVEHLRNRGKFFDREEKRECDLILIDYDDPARSVYEVTEEWAFHNGHYATREDVVFLINGIPVLVIECKNASKDEALALGVDQIRRYHRETPELFVPQQLFTATDAIGFCYGVSWNTVRRNIFSWKLLEPQISQMGADEEFQNHNLRKSAPSAVKEIPGRLEARVKTFCSIPNILSFLKDYIVFAEKDEELNKYLLRQHQTGAVEAVVRRALDPGRTRGLVWHTQGSGKTFTMIKTAERLFRAPEADKPTVLLMIDRNELEDQMLKNLAALGLGNLEHAGSIARLNQLLRDDYRGIIVTMIHKFRDMPANVNTRTNIYVLIDEAHRTTGGDLGNFLMAGLPNATFLGFTGTPVDQTAYGKGTFKTFGCEDDQGYLHKYSIADSIDDGTTLPLYYQLAPNEMRVPHETLDKEFLSLAEGEGVADIDELNKILERAVNLKNFLKGGERVQQVAEFVAAHYRGNVEPLGYKAFLVGVDREACAHYKHALDRFLPPEYSAVVYTGSNNDSRLLKEFHLDPKQERQIRKSFGKLDQQPKILIVTEKLLTGFDAPVLYALYLDKPMRDHTLLQAIARVNRPYDNEAQEMVKPHGFVLDFVGLFDKLEKALAFDSDEINAIVKDLKLLKVLFQNKMESMAPACLGLIQRQFDDKDVDTLIEHFRDPERRKEFFREYKEIEMLYEIVSPDAFLRPFMDDYGTLSAIYQVVRKAYSRSVAVDRAFQAKTRHLVQQRVGSYGVGGLGEMVAIDGDTIGLIKNRSGGEGTKVINLIQSIEKLAEEGSDDPCLVAMAERARAVQESFEQRQSSTAEALQALLQEVARNELRKKEQAEKSFDGLTYFVYRSLLDAKIQNAESVSRKIRQAFADFPNWKRSENALRELRKKVTFAIFAETDELDRVTALVDELFTLLARAARI
ncbi:MAG: HsdR family type I site-specific deoxyribonuclease [Candidatus Accumulibacter sp.]|uniref:type I restriction endonuclease subunit R n=1 Tax=Accumulibacter sp. TaxID=2053492 RepID=UPI002590AD08|nr:HsdR family type I site-specific deoxyribonuclease [Accumulibacter sp.]MCM8623304.1 HsdR family type I site-specific deoxyribonuclease [Accumulibacter sp.]